jgi:type VI secretion system protein ImpF
MSRLPAQQGITPSIIDRLIDPESEGTDWRRGYSIEEMMETVRRDVEHLLNTHRTGLAIPAEFVETKASVLGYGLPDLVSYYGLGSKLQALVSRSIEETILQYEPRLRDVRALLLTPEKGAGELRLEFRITATLCVEPASDVSFVTVLQLTTGQASVQPGGQ